MKGKFHKHCLAVLLLACAWLPRGLVAQEAADSEVPLSDLELPVSIQALMLSMIDPSAHYLWDFAARESELGDEQWLAVEQVATQLAASGPMIRLGGTGEDDPQWVQDRGWVIFARMMQSAALSALQAAQTQDEALLAEAGGRLADSCDGCHEAFRPTLDPEDMHDISPGGLYRDLP